MDTETEAIQTQFLHALYLGTGQAMLLLCAHPELDFSQHILHAACDNLAYDPQSEGSRAGYIYSLIKKSKQKTQLIAQVLQALKKQKHNLWALDQLCDLAVMLHQDGVTGARAAFLQRFEKNLLPGYEFCGDEQLLRMDGVSGLLRLAELWGKLLSAETDNDIQWSSRWVLDDFQEQNKALDVWALLAQAAQSNAHVKTYLNSMEQPASEPSAKPKKRRKPVPYSYAEVQEKIASPARYAGFIENRVTAMDQTIVDTLAHECLLEQDELRQSKYLRFFGRRPFPFGHKPILAIARKKIIGYSRLVPNAVEALSLFAGDDIRKLALKKLTGAKRREYYLLLLKHNLQACDLDLLLSLVERAEDFDQVHHLISDMLELFKANPQFDCQPVLLALYARMNCGIHRAGLLRLLVQRNALPRAILAEMQFDSYDEIRKLYRRIKRGRSPGLES
jgi:hypothetical protein